MSEETQKLQQGGEGEEAPASQQPPVASTSSGDQAQQDGADAATPLDPASSDANSKTPTGIVAGSGAKKSHKSSVQIQEPAKPPKSDKGGEYKIVKVEDKHGPLHRSIPVMPLPLAIICCLLNCFLPGVGTYTYLHTCCVCMCMCVCTSGVCHVCACW